MYDVDGNGVIELQEMVKIVASIYKMMGENQVMVMTMMMIMMMMAMTMMMMTMMAQDKLKFRWTFNSSGPEAEFLSLPAAQVKYI